MNRFNLHKKPLMWFTALLLAGLAVGCGGGSGDPILGAGVVPPLTAATLTDVIKPQVAATYPLNAGVVAPANAPITATFSEAMDLATMIAANFTVVNTTTPGAVVPTAVTYDATSKTMTFTHAGLAVGDSYTATITTGATDVALNPLASGLVGVADPAVTANYVWTFTATIADATAPTITLTSPADLDNPVPINASINITFDEPMDPTTLCSAVTPTCPVISITLEPTLSLGTFIAGAVTYDPASRIATLVPNANLAINTNYTVTVSTTATDLAGNALVVPAVGVPPNPWTFTTGTGLAPGAIALGSASTFGLMATSAITSANASVINGNVSLEPGTSITGFPPALVNGSIHINDTVSHQARADLLAAYNAAKGLPPGAGAFALSAGADPGALFPGGVPPGVYTSGSTIIATTPMVLDAMGDANAVWVFQIGSSLTTGANVSLLNGAQAKNVFWVPTLDATIGSGTTFYGTIVSGRDVTSAGNAVINGRILAGATLAGTIALNGPANTVNVPLP